MKALSRGIAALLVACAGVAITTAVARAVDDDYPNHPVRWLVGYPPGGSTDICARLIGQYLSEHLHQQFAVENKPGAGNNLATEIAAHAPPDGYMVFLVNPANAINANVPSMICHGRRRDNGLTATAADGRSARRDGGARGGNGEGDHPPRKLRQP